MFRDALKTLEEWKASSHRKPMIIEGARQVGKTWLMQEFGRRNYAEVVYVNFDGNEAMRELFSHGYDIERLILGIELHSGKRVKAQNTLLIFDEIQEVPQALTSLKYFAENAPEYQIVCAGSLLGIALHKGTSYPVGKVHHMKLYPLSFLEFLSATGRERFAELLQSGDFEMVTSFKGVYIDALKQYYFVGGMPEVVASFAEHKDFNEAREIQKCILSGYEQDFSKHAPNAIVPRIRMVWNSIPSQLAKENKKFVYGTLRGGARAKDFEEAIMWLVDAGLVHKVPRVNSGNYPPSAYEDLKAFKLFLNDVGLLCCMSALSPQVLLNGDRAFTEFKGAITEQYALLQLLYSKNEKLWYYTNDRGSCEIDLIAGTDLGTVPIEVKAETNLQAKTLKTYCEKYNPRLSVKISMLDYKREDKTVNLPLYATGKLYDVLADSC